LVSHAGTPGVYLSNALPMASASLDRCDL
jgi:hypothetical protein